MAWLRIVVGYDGSDDAINEDIARILSVRSELEEPELWWRVSSDEVRAWFVSEDPEKARSFAILFEGSKLVGLAWSFRGREGCYASIDVDASRGMEVASLYAKNLLAWARARAEELGCRSVLSVNAGLEFGYRYLVISRALGDAPRVIEWSGTLMKFVNPASVLRVVVEGFRVREGSLADSEAIARVFNRAFSRYPWFTPWGRSDVERHLKLESTRTFVIEDSRGNVVGFSMIVLRTSIKGKRVGYLDVIAVDPSYQGRGLGKFLVQRSVEELKRVGVDEIVLDSVRGVEGLYQKLGFTYVRRYLRFVVPLRAIPAINVGISRWRA